MNNPQRAPFDGVTVLSLAEQYPGPYATLLMADLGCDVILVERPAGGDPARVYPHFFAALARNKRSVALDLKSPDGRRDFLNLVKTADIVIEGFKPGTMERLGLDYARLKEHNERLIHISISGFGQTGPYRDRLAHDLSYQAVAGLLFDKAGHCAAPPMLSFGDLCGGMFAALAAVTALYARERTGLGTSVDVSMTDGLVSWMTSFLAPHMNQGAPLPVGGLPAYGMFRCADGKVLTLSVVHEDHFWRRLCALLGMEQAAGLDQLARTEHQAELSAAIQAQLLHEGSEHWAAVFDEHGIPWSPLHGLSDVAADPHFHGRGMFGRIGGEQGSALAYVAQPLKFSQFLSSVRRGAPALGEHNTEVLRNAEQGGLPKTDQPL